MPACRISASTFRPSVYARTPSSIDYSSPPRRPPLPLPSLLRHIQPSRNLLLSALILSSPPIFCISFLSPPPRKEPSMDTTTIPEDIPCYELSPEHEQILNKTFLLLQKKGTRKKNELDERDVGTLIRALGFNPSDNLVEEIIQKAKMAQSKKVTQGYLDYPYFEEAFAEAFTLHKQEFVRHSEEEILEALRVITPDGKDFLEPQALKKLLMDTPNGFSDEEVDKMMQAFKDKDTGLLWHDDIVEVLAKDGLPSSSPS